MSNQLARQQVKLWFDLRSWQLQLVDSIMVSIVSRANIAFIPAPLLDSVVTTGPLPELYWIWQVYRQRWRAHLISTMA
jgi:hypothetical protein